MMVVLRESQALIGQLGLVIWTLLMYWNLLELDLVVGPFSHGRVGNLGTLYEYHAANCWKCLV